MTKPAASRKNKLTVKKDTLKDLDPKKKDIKGGYYSQGNTHCNDNTCNSCVSCAPLPGCTAAMCQF